MLCILSIRITCEQESTGKSDLKKSHLAGQYESFHRESSIKFVRKIFRKTNSSHPLIRTRTCTYQGGRNASFSENFAYVLNGWPVEYIFPKKILAS